MARAMYRQGDVLIVAIADLPQSAAPLRDRDGRLVLAEGEATGHAHTVDASAGSLWTEIHRDARFLVVDAEAGAEVTHQEHDALRLPRGMYAVVRQREYVPEGQQPQFVAD